MVLNPTCKQCSSLKQSFQLLAQQHTLRRVCYRLHPAMPSRRSRGRAAQASEHASSAEHVPFSELPPMLRLHVISWRATMLLRPVWFLFFLGACWSVLVRPGLLTGLMPPAVLHAVSSTTTKMIPILKVMPTSRAASWQLGHLAGQAHVLQGSGAAVEQLEGLRTQAAGLLGMPTDQMTLDLLLKLGDLIQDHEKPNGVLARVKGMFKFANMMWLVGILGVAVSIGPALAVILGPVITLALQIASTLFKVLWAITRPFHYAVALYGCAALVAAGQVHPVPVVGSRLSLAGVVFAVVLLIYSYAPHTDALGGRNYTMLVNLFATAALAPLAYAHQSPLLGFFCVAALFGALGFGIIPTGMGWLVGFFGDNTMLMCSLTSALLLGILSALRLADQGGALAAPFQLGISVFGTNALLLAGLIQSSVLYLTYNSSARLAEVPLWAQIFGWNAAYLLVLFGMAFGGAWMGLDSMFAVAVTYMALWLSEKSVELAVRAQLFWVAILLFSLCLCGGGHFIHTHPEWIAKVLS